MQEALDLSFDRLLMMMMTTPWSPQWSLSLRFPHQDPIHSPLLTHTLHMPNPSHPSRHVTVLLRLQTRPVYNANFYYFGYRVTISVGFSGSVVPGEYQANTEFCVSSSVHRTVLLLSSRLVSSRLVSSRYFNTEKAKLKLSLGLISKI